MSQHQRSIEAVKRYYGEVLKSSADLQTSACCVGASPAPYIAEILKDVHEEVKDRFYGCGSPIPPALDGVTVLALGVVELGRQPIHLGLVCRLRLFDRLGQLRQRLPRLDAGLELRPSRDTRFVRRLRLLGLLRRGRGASDRRRSPGRLSPLRAGARRSGVVRRVLRLSLAACAPSSAASADIPRTYPVPQGAVTSCWSPSCPRPLRPTPARSIS